MSETTTGPGTTAAVDDGARFRAFTGLGLALVALTGGGVVANGVQWLVIGRFPAGDDLTYWSVVGGVPLLMGLVGLWLGTGAASSADALARPLGRATQALSALAVLGAVVLVVALVLGQ
ncbi:hypothetical protein [Nocardioides xinjiangensis]|uniref:hypothetical protein n=1 Tax=Nocardioides xinjiangensis TaxID=2817376 RepID=UPI001FEE9F58|nr:hypothetical protein [Nocardioides sp. SYSU D00778]